MKRRNFWCFWWLWFNLNICHLSFPDCGHKLLPYSIWIECGQWFNGKGRNFASRRRNISWVSFTICPHLAHMTRVSNCWFHLIFNLFVSITCDSRQALCDSLKRNNLSISQLSIFERPNNNATSKCNTIYLCM